MKRVQAVLGPLLVAVATLGVFFGGKRLLFDTPDGYVVQAEFADSAGLRKNSAVKVGGVPAGEVTRITLTDRDTALVRMRLDDEAAPVGAGAHARSRPVNLLGEKYVDLRPGDVRAPARSGTTIPQDRTDASVELDDVLNALDPDVRGRLRILINESGVALAGRGADFNALLQGLPPALDELQQLVDNLGADTDRMHRLIARGHRVVRAVDAGRDDLGRLVVNAADVLDDTARRRAELGRTIRDAPATLRQLRSSVYDLGTAAGRLAPGATQLRRAAGPLRAVLEQAPAFAEDAERTLDTAADVAPALARLGRRGRPTVARLRPVAEDLRAFATRLDPVVRTLDGTIRDALGFVHGYARAQQQRDGLGHRLRLREIIGRDALDAVLDRYVRRPVRRTTPGRGRPRPAVPKLPVLSPKPQAPRPTPTRMPARPSVPDVVDRTLETTKGLVEGLLRP